VENLCGPRRCGNALSRLAGGWRDEPLPLDLQRSADLARSVACRVLIHALAVLAIAQRSAV